MIYRISGTLAVGAAMLLGGHVTAMAQVACTSFSYAVASAPGFSCIQQDKIWSDFHFDGVPGETALPGDAVLSFALHRVSPSLQLAWVVALGNGRRSCSWG